MRFFSVDLTVVRAGSLVLWRRVVEDSSFWRKGHLVRVGAIAGHLAEVVARVTPGKHCALLVGQAGWHVSDRLAVPANITIVPLPAKCPELNPVENVWQFLRGNWLSNRIFRSYDAIVDHCCDAWNRLADQPWRVMSLGLRSWVPGHRP